MYNYVYYSQGRLKAISVVFLCAFRRAYLSNVEFAGNLQRSGQSIAELEYRMLKECISAEQSSCKTITDENNTLILTPSAEFPLN